MLPAVINVYKNCGQTPLECIGELKKNNKDLVSLPMTYAGRLDPLAEGVLLILVGDECLKKEEYLNLPKEYEVDVLFGFATDTYDLMGRVVESKNTKEFLDKYTSSENIQFERSSDEGDGSRCQTILNTSFDSALRNENWYEDFALEIQKILPKFIGKIKQKYPPYSSRPVNGKPLFMWAREGRLGEIEIPTHDVFIKNIEIIKEKEVTGENLHEKIKNDIAKVKGDFRQEEILKIWEKALENSLEENFPVLTIRVSCGSGAYMRSLAHELGQAIGTQSLALHITRTKVGDYTIQK